MKKWAKKLIFSMLVISISSLYANGAMAMHKNSDDNKFCNHCYVQEVLNCELNTVLTPNHTNNDFDQIHPPHHNSHFYLPTENFHLSTSNYHYLRPGKDKIPAPIFTTNKVVLLI